MPAPMPVYRALSRFRRPRSYLGKFLLTAFLGVHVPLIALVVFVVMRVDDWRATIPILVVTLVATLLGTAATLLVQGRLLTPVLETSRALEAYARDRTLPDLPLDYVDEAGALMRNAQSAVTQLEQLLQLKNDLLAVLSHDTRAPVSTILMANSMNADLLGQPQPDLELVRRMNGVIDSSARRQLELMNNILVLARSDTGAVELRRSRVVPGELLRRVAENARLQAERKHIRVTVSDRTSADVRVELDAPKTEQVLNNLMHNAIKFTPEGGSVELSASTDDGAMEFAVSDSGIGMAPEVREHLFTPFAPGHRPGTAGEAGTGLGLWISKTFTELQGGTIEVDSRQQHGSRFRVRLPTVAPVEQTDRA